MKVHSCGLPKIVHHRNPHSISELCANLRSRNLIVYHNGVLSLHSIQDRTGRVALIIGGSARFVAHVGGAVTVSNVERDIDDISSFDGVVDGIVIAEIVR